MRAAKICFILLLIIPFLASAQTDKLGLVVPQVVKTSGSRYIDLVLRGNSRELQKAAKAHNWQVTLTAPQMVAVRLNADQIKIIDTLECIEFVEFSTGRPQILNDKMLVNNNILPVHQGAGNLAMPVVGSGVIIGIVDTGIELLHPDFRNEDGTTRILALWDQTQPEEEPDHVPQPYGYGQEWSAAEIDAGITGHEDAEGYYGHGSNVAGVAAGNGLASNAYKGVAPESDLVIVSSDFNHPNWLMSVAHAVAYIFAKAEAAGKPAVVNLSLGDYLGSHDGKDAAALFIDSLLQAHPGRVVVSAAGNSGNFSKYHLQYTLQAPDTVFSWFKYNAASVLGQGAVFFEAWADTADLNTINYSVGADFAGQPYQFRGYVPFRNIQQNLNTIITDTLRYQGADLGIVKTWGGLRGGQYLLQVSVTNVLNAGYLWRFAATGTGTFDIWSSAALGTSTIVDQNLPATSAYADMHQYLLPDSLKSIVSSWNCSDHVISVGNYINRDRFLNYSEDTTFFPVTPGHISKNSSRGPTRDGRQKPDLAASGDNTISSGSFPALNLFINTEPHKVAYTGLHNINGGTSLAAPVVAGTAALLLSRCPQMGHLTVKSILNGTATPDQYTGVLPNILWGHGKLNAFAALNSVADEVSVSLDNTSFCAGSVVVATAENGFEDYLWSHGESGSISNFSQPGNYYVQAVDAAGCIQYSHSFELQMLPQPAIPVIAVAGDTLQAPAASAWQWYFNGTPISGATGASLIASDFGLYQVEVFNAQQCSSISEPYGFFPAGIPSGNSRAITLYPNPGKEVFNLSGLASGDYQIELYAPVGQKVLSQKIKVDADVYPLHFEGVSAGFYVLKIWNSNFLPLKFTIVVE